MKKNDSTDRLDLLLRSAAAECEKVQIEEYKAECEDAGLKPDFLKEIRENRQGTVEVKQKRPFRKRFIAYFAAAMLAVTLAAAGIAGKNRESAALLLGSDEGETAITFDMSGIKPNDKASFKLSENALEGFEMKTYTDENGRSVTMFISDDGEATLEIFPLSRDTEIILEGDAWHSFDVVLCGKYNGILLETNAKGYTESAVIWNDGDFAFSFMVPLGAEDALEIAASFYTD